MATRNTTLLVRYEQTQTANKVSSSSYADRFYNSTKTGTSLPNWRQVIAQGGSATTGMSSTVREGTSQRGFVTVHYRGAPTATWPTGVAEMSLSGRIVVPTIFETGSVGVTEADNMAVQRVVADAQRVQMEMSGPTFLGELREAIRGIRRPAQGLLRGLNRYALAQRRIIAVHPRWQRYERRSALADALTDTWLEHSFSWVPLLSDCEGAARALGRLYANSGDRKTARGYGEVEQSLISSTSKTSYGLQFFGILNVNRKTKTKVVYKVWLKANPTSPPGSLSRLLDLTGFSFEQFVPTVWNLIPFSFVVDYFSNVGNLLTAISFNSSMVSFIKKDVIFETTEHQTSELDLASIQTSLGLNFLGAVGSYGRTYARTKQVVRSAPSSLPIPALQFDLPDSDSLAWLNLAALYRNLVVR